MRKIIATAFVATLLGCTTPSSSDTGTCADETTGDGCAACCEGEGATGHNFFVDENSNASCTCDMPADDSSV